LANLRKWDVINPTKSLKMKWLRNEVFPGKSPEEIHALASKAEGSLYSTVTHEARDVNPKDAIRLGKTEKDISYSLHDLGEGPKEKPVIHEMQAWVSKALERFGFKGKIVIDNRENFPKNAQRADPSAEGFITPDGTIYIDAARNKSYADAIYTAFHEAYHRGELGSEAEPYAKALERAGKNPTVAAIADQIKEIYRKYGYGEIGNTRAIREALADIHGAQKTGRWDELKARSAGDVDVSPLARAGAYGAVRRVIDAIKSVFNKMLGRKMTDREVLDLTENTFKKSTKPVQTTNNAIEQHAQVLKSEQQIDKLGPELDQSLSSLRRPQDENKGAILQAATSRLDRQLQNGAITKSEHMAKTAALNEKYGEQPQSHYQDLNEPLSTLGKSARAWSYFSMLTSLRTIPRILATSINETAIRPVEELLGIVNSKIAPKIAALSPRYGGGLSGVAEKKAFDAIFQGKEYASMLRTGRTSIDANIGDLLDRYRGKIPQEDFEQLEELANNWKMMASAHTGLLAAPGRLHGALHTMPMLAEYARSTEKRTAFTIKNLKAQDMSDKQAAMAVMQPLAQLDIQMGAYGDALSAAYRGETTVGKYYDKAIKSLRDGNAAANAVASLLQITNPFVKVSANLFSRATSFLAGGVKAGLEYSKSKREGFMTPEQADYIIKNMNAQGVGVGALILGMMYYKQFGGLYDQKTYNRRDIPETGTVNIAGVRVPPHVLEHPAIQLMNLGAMVTRGFFEHRGSEAALAGAKDLANIASVVRSSGDLSKALESSKGGLKYLADMVTSRLIPAPVRDVAAIQDYMDNGPGHPNAIEALWHYMVLDDGIKRKVKTGEDVLRKQLPKTEVNPDFNVQSLQRRE
jgi:hypothetical protein